MVLAKMVYAKRSRPKKRRLKTWWLLLTIVLLVSTRSQAWCPEACSCTHAIDSEGSMATHVACKEGGMAEVPIDELDRFAQTLIITAPPERPNYLTIGPIFIQPVPFTNLRELHIVNSNVPSIGQFSFWGLQNLRILNLAYNNLSSVVSDNFRGLINLTELFLDHNHIEEMASETFRHLPALQTLDLSNNEISNLVARLFRMLANLTYLDLSDNPLTDLNPEVFKDIQHLRIFKCRRCQLARVNPQLYHLIPRLEELELSDNRYNTLNPDEFFSLRRLKKLRLDGNQIPVIVDHMFAQQSELRLLSVARNRLAMLAPAALSNLTSLTHLDISENKIEKFFHHTFNPVIQSLKTINFSGNNLLIGEISLVLQALPKLQTVGLANLSIDEIPSHLFYYNEHLISLDLSWNLLTSFPMKLLLRARFLQKLDLSHNQLERLDEMALERLEAIPHINLVKNNWYCDQCSASSMLLYMTTTVLNDSIRPLKCSMPYRLRGVSFAELTFDRLEACPSSHEAQLSVIAGLMLLCFAVLGAVATALCCTRRRSQHYYTHEEKRRERRSDHPEEMLVPERGGVATIHTPYHVVARS